MRTRNGPIGLGEGWFRTSGPRTVLAALVANDVYRDPYFAKNMEEIPTEQFTQPWWYWNEFSLDGHAGYSSARLIFEGINYRANIWLNGRQIATTDHAVGSFRMFDFEVSQVLSTGKNRLAVEVLPPKPGDFTIGFVDWNPTPPDRNMGLWRPVKLRLTGPVSIENPFVATRLNLETLSEARLTITSTLVNRTEKAWDSTVRLEYAGHSGEKTLHLDANQEVKVEFGPEEFEWLHVQNPDLWWPNNLGRPSLHNLRLSARTGSVASDTRDVRFGIREVGDYFNEDGHRGYTVNGTKILIRGAGCLFDPKERD